ncbi:MAG: hypothetical protein H6Q28_1694, partial [Bacteroidetes bacterium]|nr:hypothetical protein [Bacteroidota bacterium]
HLAIPLSWTVEHARRFPRAVRNRIRDGLGSDASVMMHVDLCVSACCPFCRVNSCKARSVPFRAESDWGGGISCGGCPTVARNHRDGSADEKPAPHDRCLFPACHRQKPRCSNTFPCHLRCRGRSRILHWIETLGFFMEA